MVANAGIIAVASLVESKKFGSVNDICNVVLILLD